MRTWFLGWAAATGRQRACSAATIQYTRRSQWVVGRLTHPFTHPRHHTFTPTPTYGVVSGRPPPRFLCSCSAEAPTRPAIPATWLADRDPNCLWGVCELRTDQSNDRKEHRQAMCGYVCTLPQPSNGSRLGDKSESEHTHTSSSATTCPRRTHKRPPTHPIPQSIPRSTNGRASWSVQSIDHQASNVPI